MRLMREANPKEMKNMKNTKSKKRTKNMINVDTTGLAPPDRRQLDLAKVAAVEWALRLNEDEGEKGKQGTRRSFTVMPRR